MINTVLIFDELVENPDYIFKDKNINTALAAKSINKDGSSVNIAIRLATEADDPDFISRRVSRWMKLRRRPPGFGGADTATGQSDRQSQRPGAVKAVSKETITAATRDITIPCVINDSAAVKIYIWSKNRRPLSDVKKLTN